MDPAVRAILTSWSLPPGLALPLAVGAIVYFRGFLALHRRVPRRFPAWRAASFLSGLGVVFFAIASPLDPIGALLLQVHMAQHVLLMLVAPPLLLGGAPWLPLLRGLPRTVRRDGLGPFLRSPGLRRAGRIVLHPVTAWLAFVVTAWAWHAPAAYDLALRARGWHEVEHACFLLGGVLFWWPVIEPWPSRPAWPRWAIVPYLLLAALQNTALSAILTFSDGVLYPAYAAAPRLWGVAPLGDQAAAGAILWVLGSLAMLVPAAALVVRLLEPERPAPAPPARTAGPPKGRSRRRLDLLAVPGVGWLVRASAFRRTLQAGMLLLAAATVADGFLGPQVAPLNLAGVLPWTHLRGFLVLGLVLGGSALCAACPLVLARDVGRRVLPARLRWPRRLRGKWISVGLVALYLWVYEAFSLWNRPAWTAWLIVGYFVAAVAIDGIFRGAAFCKHVCPIGQFQMLHATASPAEVAVRDPDACRRCRTLDCIRGNAGSRGCELELFLPSKVGNLDCSFCLDCARACPHDNVGVVPMPPGREIATDRFRSSIGRPSRRPDVAALALVLCFGAFVNAGAMVAPVAALLDRLGRSIGGASHAVVSTLTVLPAVVLAPAVAALGCAAAARILGGLRRPLLETVSRFAPTLLPLGLGMWLAHLGFHLATGGGAAVAALARAAASVGLPAGALGSGMAGAVPAGRLLLELELLALGTGLVLTVRTAWRVALETAATRRRAAVALLPWGMLAVALWLAGVWIVFQPMQMRGTMAMG